MACRGGRSRKGSAAMVPCQGSRPLQRTWPVRAGPGCGCGCDACTTHNGPAAWDREVLTEKEVIWAACSSKHPQSKPWQHSALTGRATGCAGPGCGSCCTSAGAGPGCASGCGRGSRRHSLPHSRRRRRSRRVRRSLQGREAGKHASWRCKPQGEQGEGIASQPSTLPSTPRTLTAPLPSRPTHQGLRRRGGAARAWQTGRRSRCRPPRCGPGRTWHPRRRGGRRTAGRSQGGCEG